jgi:hypothetical protein
VRIFQLSPAKDRQKRGCGGKGEGEKEAVNTNAAHKNLKKKTAEGLENSELGWILRSFILRVGVCRGNCRT